MRRWSCRAAVNVFSCQGPCLQWILVPLHLNGNHWALAAVEICYFDSLGCPACVIHYLDSLGSSPPDLLVARLGQFLQGEYNTTVSTSITSALPIEDCTMPSCSHSPRQQKCNDCGVIMCFCAHHLVARLGLDFDTSVSTTTCMRFSIIASIIASKLVTPANLASNLP